MSPLFLLLVLSFTSTSVCSRGKAALVKIDTNLTNPDLLDSALVYNLKGKSSFVDSFRNPQHWITRQDSDVELELPDVSTGEGKQSSLLVFLSQIQLPRDPLYPTITSANSAFGRGMSGGKPKAVTWSSHRNGTARSWILPPYHPRQLRQQCLAATVAASQQPTLFYKPLPLQMPEYTLYLSNALVNINGIVGTLDGYVQFREGCEHQEKLGRLWHRPLVQSFKRLHPTAKTPKAHQEAWNAAFAAGDVSFSGYPPARSMKKGSKDGVKPQGNVKPGVVLDTVFVMDAIWDFNFHHALLDSVARIVHWYPYLVAHPEVFVHIRCFELYTKVSHADRFKYLNFRQTLFTFLGIDMQRVIYGEVAARVVLAPRQLGCMVYTKHQVTLRALAQLLALRSYGPAGGHQLSAMGSTDYYQCRAGAGNSKKRKRAIVQVRPCPPHVVASEEQDGPNSVVKQRFWRCLDEAAASRLQTAFSRALGAEQWSVSTSSNFASHNDEDAMRVFACAVQEYLEPDVSLLVGVHGAGLTNLMFLRPGSIVVEIIGQFDGRMTPLCGFHGPLASVYDVHHYVYYYDALNGDTLDVDQLAREVRAFVTVVEAANSDGGGGQGRREDSFSRLPTQYYDKTTDLYTFEQ